MNTASYPVTTNVRSGKFGVTTLLVTGLISTCVPVQGSLATTVATALLAVWYRASPASNASQC